MALHNHAAAHDGQLPTAGAPAAIPGTSGSLERTGRVGDREQDGSITPAVLEWQTWGWGYQLLPFLDLENRHLNPSDENIVASQVSFYNCRNRDRWIGPFGDVTGLSDYVGNGGSQTDLTSTVDPGDGYFKQVLHHSGSNTFDALLEPRRLSDIRDGLGQTIAVTEKRVLAAPQGCNDTLGWTAGRPVYDSNGIIGMDMLFSGAEGGPALDVTDLGVQCTARAGAPHPGGIAMVLFADGHVAQKTTLIDTPVWQAMCSIAGRKDVDAENDVLH